MKRKNVLKDFISVAGPLHVTHFMMFTKTDVSSQMRLVRLPRGPTLTFKLKNYTLSKDVITSLKRHNMAAKQFQHHPLLVMNGFSGEGMHLKLMTTMFQNMFPSINVNKVCNLVYRYTTFSASLKSFVNHAVSNTTTGTSYLHLFSSIFESSIAVLYAFM